MVPLSKPLRRAITFPDRASLDDDPLFERGGPQPSAGRAYPPPTCRRPRQRIGFPYSPRRRHTVLADMPVT
jgi:hypothetical protein